MKGSFNVEVGEKNGIWIFTTHGYINNLGGEAIAEKFEEALKKGGTKFLFNLADSRLVNSIGVSILIEILEKTQELKAVMAFCSCVSIVAKTFNIMGLTQYAKLYDSVEEGLEDMA